MEQPQGEYAYVAANEMDGTGEERYVRVITHEQHERLPVRNQMDHNDMTDRGPNLGLLFARQLFNQILPHINLSAIQLSSLELHRDLVDKILELARCKTATIPTHPNIDANDFIVIAQHVRERMLASFGERPTLKWLAHIITLYIQNDRDAVDLSLHKSMTKVTDLRAAKRARIADEDEIDADADEFAGDLVDIDGLLDEE